MYGDWISLLGNEDGGNRLSVLERLPLDSAKDVVVPVARHIVSTLGISQAPLPSPFATDPEVEWCLQVVCYGLSLQLSEHDVIKDCVNIYCEWLSCLSPTPKISVPKPITERPNYFARKMINHLYHLFTPRKGEGVDTINRQAVLCHRVLRTLQTTMKTSEILDSETWECALLFLISISDAILSPPTSEIGDQLCERVLSVLFEVWLLACGKCFPSPSLWKTLRESCQAWRHRPNLFDQWNRINLILARRVLRIMYGADYIQLDKSDSDLVPDDMSNDAVVQTWFRFLHCIGNPVELTQPTIISQTQSFLQYAIASTDVVDPCQHPTLSILPSIFHSAMSGISVVVDAFLGLPRTSILSLATGRSKDHSNQPPTTPQGHVSVTSTSSSSSLTILDSLPLQAQQTPAAARPKINSVLHLFGPWLFDAALASSNANFGGEPRRTSRGSVPVALPESVDIPQAITIDKYYQGRAEALGTLCRIFCSKKTGEEILAAYIARFYITIRKGLKDPRTEVVNSILSNSWNLLRVDLDGVSMLVPNVISALETVLPNKEVSKRDLRRSGIQLLLSMIPLPLHFMNLPIKDMAERNSPGVSFLQLKPKLANLLISTLQVETDSMNIQMLLGGLILFVIDTATYEETDKASLTLGMESPTNLLSSENTSTRSASEYSNSFDEHMNFPSESWDGQFDTAHALFVRTTYLVCHRLISTWKTDLPVSLAALELLSALARTKVHDQDPLECRRAVKWICDFIIHQCSRPPPAHSRDLHSSIVAAFQCVTTWLLEHPYLIEDKDSLCTVLEVVEYGISGMKSQGKPGDPVKLKDQKDLKPVSLRVRDAAEALLAIIFEQVGKVSPVQNGSDRLTSSSLVDELTLLNQLKEVGQMELSREQILNHFRYFVIDNSILIGLLEDQLENGHDPQPSVSAILRCPTGRHAWNLQLRHMPKCKEKSFTSNSENPGRPLPMNDVGIYHEVEHRYFPETADRIIECRADKAIPTLESLAANLPGSDAYEENRLSVLLENQIQEENRLATKLMETRERNLGRTECEPPLISRSFQTARLLLSHLGLISSQIRLENVGIHQKLVPIDSRISGFDTELDALDSTSCRAFDTVHIFYVRAGQRKPADILSNVESRATTHPHFLEFLLSLGWPVRVTDHSGWTGNLKTSWNSHIPLQSSQKKGGHTKENGMTGFENHGGSLYSGESHILHWADVTSEIAFVVPTRRNGTETTKTLWNMAASTGSEPPSASLERDKALSYPVPLLHSKSLEATPSEKLGKIHESDEGPKARKPNTTKVSDAKIFVVWLESYEDSFTFPATELVSCTCTGLENNPIVTDPSLIIFIHALRNGLFRIHMSGESLRMGLSTPLIDGMIVSRRVLGNLVRQTALNMARRKRLENDSFQPPHVRRKMKIQEIQTKFQHSKSYPEFYAHFFHKPTKTDDENVANGDNLRVGVEV